MNNNLSVVKNEAAVMPVNISKLIIPAFHDFWRQCNSKRKRKLFKVLKGGRNSSKSSHISLRIIWDMMRNPVNTLAVRKVGNTLSESVFEQLVWAIDMLDVARYWKVNKSPLRLTYKPRGNMIIFRGADDPKKIKSLKTSKFPVAILWIEELAEFKTEEEVSTIVNSVLRAELPQGIEYDIYYSYNPPKRKQSWVNKKFESSNLPGNVYVHHSDYTQNPFVSKEFINEAMECKAKSEYKYKWEYLGEPIGSGVVPFENLQFKTITAEQKAIFDNIKQGLDFGYGIDPLAFIRAHFDRTRRILYIYGEIYGVKMSNRTFANKMKEKQYDDDLTLADSEDPRTINELKELELRIAGAKKGPGSVEFGEKWLDELNAIIIDPASCPNTAREFEEIDYEIDQHGNVGTRLSGKDNHTIDATRYALNTEMKYKSGSVAAQTQ